MVKKKLNSTRGGATSAPLGRIISLCLRYQVVNQLQRVIMEISYFFYSTRKLEEAILPNAFLKSFSSTEETASVEKPEPF